MKMYQSGKWSWVGEVLFGILAVSSVAKLWGQANLPPALIGANTRGEPNAVYVLFNEPVEDTSASDANNYQIDHGISVNAAALQADLITVKLSVSALTSGTTYTLIVNNIMDRDPAPATITPNSPTRILDTQGVLSRKVFYNIPGTGQVSELTSDPRFPNQPDDVTYVDLFENPNNVAEYFGTQVAGYLEVPVSGNYTFYVASDDQCVLFLSTDADPANKVQIASEPAWNTIRAWTTTFNRNPVNPENRSAPIPLVAGQKYYVEALTKDGILGDNFGATWQLAGAPMPNDGDPPILGLYLSSLKTSGPVTFSQQPASQTVIENQPLLLQADVEGTPPYTVQWHSNNVPISGATSLKYSLPSVAVGDNGADFHVTVANAFSFATSAHAILTVQSDATAPTVLSATGSSSLDTVVLAFSEPLDPVTAANTANYSLDGGLNVNSATLFQDGMHVTLLTSPQTFGATYTVTVNNVADLAAVPNVIAPNSQATFQAFNLVLGALNVEIYTNIPGDLASLLNHPRFPHFPDITGNLRAFDSRQIFPDDSHENYGGRISGWFIPDETTSYNFFLRSDNDSQLWLSSDANPANKVLLAEELGCCQPFLEPGAPQTSTAIPLVAGQRYYIEALWKEGILGDYCQVAFRRGSDNTPAWGLHPISTQFLEGAVDPNQPNTSLTVGNLVFNDLNQDGIQQQGEAGIPNVRVSIFRDDGDGIFQPGFPDVLAGGAATDLSGHYYVTGLVPGKYWVQVDSGNFDPGQKLYGWLSTPGFGAADNDADGDDNGQDNATPRNGGIVSTLLTLSNGGEPGVNVDGDNTDANSTVDFGFFLPANAAILGLGSTVWNDLNSDGIRQPNEPGIPHVQVNFYRDDGDGIFQAFNPDTFAGFAGTDANGNYSFAGLSAGDYWVQIEQGSFYSGGALFGLLSSPGYAAANNDLDNDDNGQDNATPRNGGIVSTLITLANNTEPDVAVDGNDTNNNSTVDFGFYSPADPLILSIGGTVWNDLNADGIRQANEPGIPIVQINFFQDDGDGVFEIWNPDIFFGFAVTDANGNYTFAGLAPGNYWAWVEGVNFGAGGALFGFANSPGFGVANNDVKGDDSGQDNVSAAKPGFVSTLITLNHGGEPDVNVDGDDTNANSTVDFGFYIPLNQPIQGIGGTIWNDLNSDGIRQAAEPALPNVYVLLFRDDGDGIFQQYNPDNFIGGTSTDANGYYLFNGLAPGRYWVYLSQHDFNHLNALFGFVSSPGVGAADNDLANDDSGQDDSEPQVNGIASTLVTLSLGGEPDFAVDGDNLNINSTIDFGFYSPPNPPIQGIGGTIWNDLNGDGIRQAGEPLIPNVYVQAFRDDGDGIFQAYNPDTYVGAASTDANGYYFIYSLKPGRYWIFLSEDDFNSLNALFSLVSSPGFGAADNDLANDDSGQDDPQPQVNGIVSTLVTLSIGGEPDVAVDGDGSNINSTIDFGFMAPPPANSSPTIQCPQAITVECSAPLNVSVTVVDPDNDGLTVSLLENNQVIASQTIPAGNTAGGLGVNFNNLSLPLGAHTLTAVVNDGVNSSVSCDVNVAVQDTTPPQISSVTANPGRLRELTNRLTKVVVSATATDNCGPVTCKIISVTSSDPIVPLPSGRTEPYWLITENLTVYLRAGRNSPRVPRVYTLTVECKDAAGNASTKTVEVAVAR